jgi:tRNA A-37 threonylcarbamoyl transferase component Bud32
MASRCRTLPEAAAAFVSYHLWLEQQRISQSYELPELDQVIRNWRHDSSIIVVENAHVAHVEGVGILRMVYWADTENTSQWFRDLHRERQDALFSLRA